MKNATNIRRFSGAWFMAHGGDVAEAAPAAGELAEALTFEQYAAQHGADRLAIVCLGLDSPGRANGKATVNARLRRVEERIRRWAMRRENLRAEYDSAVAAGLIRPPTHMESLMTTARGHSDNPSVQAARRLLKRRGLGCAEGAQP